MRHQIFYIFCSGLETSIDDGADYLYVLNGTVPFGTIERQEDKDMIDNAFTSLFSLRAVMRHNEEYLKDTARDLGIFPMDLLVLTVMHDNYDLHHARDLAEELRCSRGRISESVDRLEKSGMLEKAEVKADRRKTELKLTEKAEEILRRAEKSFRELEDIVFRGFSKEERSEFTRLAGKLTVNIGSGK